MLSTLVLESSKDPTEAISICVLHGKKQDVKHNIYYFKTDEEELSVKLII